ncbi:hypothetical protein JL720_5517 [Aureococcus anophagefferens]|nr:hypothetical protein JL720_5517 [Aureococcus anophagefferens]
MRSRRQRSPIRAARRALSLKLPKSPPPKIHACLRHLWRAAGAAAKGAGVAASGALDALIRVALLLDGAARWAAASRGPRRVATVVFASCCLPEPPKKPADEYFAPPPRDEAAASPTDSVCSCSSSSLASDDGGDDDDSFVDVGAECACDDAEWTAVSS